LVGAPLVGAHVPLWVPEMQGNHWGNYKGLPYGGKVVGVFTS